MRELTTLFPDRQVKLLASSDNASASYDIVMDFALDIVNKDGGDRQCSIAYRDLDDILDNDALKTGLYITRHKTACIVKEKVLIPHEKEVSYSSELLTSFPNITDIILVTDGLSEDDVLKDIKCASNCLYVFKREGDSDGHYCCQKIVQNGYFSNSTKMVNHYANVFIDEIKIVDEQKGDDSVSTPPPKPLGYYFVKTDANVVHLMNNISTETIVNEEHFSVVNKYIIDYSHIVLKNTAPSQKYTSLRDKPSILNNKVDKFSSVVGQLKNILNSLPNLDEFSYVKPSTIKPLANN